MDTTLHIIDGGRFHCTAANWLARGNWNEMVKVYAPTEGEAWVAVDGQRTSLAADELYLIPPHHRLDYAARPEMTVDWIHFIPSSPLVDAQLATIAEVYPFTTAMANRWLPVMRQCAQFFMEPTPGLTFRMQAMISELAGQALETSPAITADKRLLPALRYMDDHATEPVILAELARCVGVSPEHFHRLFRAQFHITPFNYLLRRRMAKARQLLAGGIFSVKEVAVQCGYDDAYYFSRVFRRYYHCTPRDVRTGKIQPVP